MMTCLKVEEEEEVEEVEEFEELNLLFPCCTTCLFEVVTVVVAAAETSVAAGGTEADGSPVLVGGGVMGLTTSGCTRRK